jgi:phenylpyruvate tautomerase PptA (4-oxalocrotonate tautomerase family)
LPTEIALGPLEQPVWVILDEGPLTDWGVAGKPMRAPQDKL